RKPFPIVVDLEASLRGYQRLSELATHDDLIVPGHDPLVTELFPTVHAPFIFRLDQGPTQQVPA
ncbi:MAG: N-acyl homoserine lactonase family protein, partial [Pseudomonadota bacterium]